VLDRTTVEYRYQHPERGLIWIHHLVHVLQRNAAGSAVRTIGVLRDITAQKEAELNAVRDREKLAHLSRVASMGELVASLAHELNQPLTAIQSNAQAGQRLLASGEMAPVDIRDILADIVADNQRAAEVIRRVRSLLKKHEIDLKRTDLNVVIREVMVLLRTDAIVKGVAVKVHLTSAPLPVIGDAIQLQQVLLNLVVNAFDAMLARPAGERELVVRSSRSETGEAVVAVQDSGSGIPPDRMDRLFEPFCTTKPEGLGMGLVICRSIAESHGGRVWAENAPARGALFQFVLPLTKEKAVP
jgi:C4-dicarboxylate-specific signal transduction histidine kinase